MSSKHPPLPDTDAVAVAKEIGWARVALEREGKQPMTVQISPALWDLFRPMWGNGEVRALVGLLAVRDETVERFEIRCRN